MNLVWFETLPRELSTLLNLFGQRSRLHEHLKTHRQKDAQGLVRQLPNPGWLPKPLTHCAVRIATKLITACVCSSRWPELAKFKRWVRRLKIMKILKVAYLR